MVKRLIWVFEWALKNTVMCWLRLTLGFRYLGTWFYSSTHVFSFFRIFSCPSSLDFINTLPHSEKQNHVYHLLLSFPLLIFLKKSFPSPLSSFHSCSRCFPPPLLCLCYPCIHMSGSEELGLFTILNPFQMGAKKNSSWKKGKGTKFPSFLTTSLDNICLFFLCASFSFRIHVSFFSGTNPICKRKGMSRTSCPKLTCCLYLLKKETANVTRMLRQISQVPVNINHIFLCMGTVISGWITELSVVHQCHRCLMALWKKVNKQLAVHWQFDFWCVM